MSVRLVAKAGVAILAMLLAALLPSWPVPGQVPQ